MNRTLTTLALTLGLAGALPGAPQESVASGLGPGDSVQTMPNGRRYLLHVPLRYDGHKPLPLVFILHGFGGSAQGMTGATGMSTKADEENFIVAYLNGTPCVVQPDVQGCTAGQLAWNNGLSPELGITVDDVGHVRDVLKSLQEQLRVDVRRVYAAGLSNGGFMCHRLGAELSDVLAGVAIVEGTIGVRQSDGEFLTIAEPAGSIPVAIVHGKLDPNVRYEGGPGGGSGELDVKSVADAVAFWTTANRCQDGPQTEASADGNVVITSYRGCFANSDVVLFTIGDGVHKWPRADDTELIGLSATDAIWEFFSKHPRT